MLLKIWGTVKKYFADAAALYEEKCKATDVDLLTAELNETKNLNTNLLEALESANKEIIDTQRTLNNLRRDNGNSYIHIYYII